MAVVWCWGERSLLRPHASPWARPCWRDFLRGSYLLAGRPCASARHGKKMGWVRFCICKCSARGRSRFRCGWVRVAPCVFGVLRGVAVSLAWTRELEFVFSACLFRVVYLEFPLCPRKTFFFASPSAVPRSVFSRQRFRRCFVCAAV